MAFSQNLFTIGTATQTVVAPTNDYAEYVLKNLQPGTPEELARDGHVFLIGQQFSIPAGGTVAFSMTTGATGAQFDFYQIVSESASIIASLIEGATITTTGNPIPAYNLNRTKSDSHMAVFRAATAVTGGTVVSSEFVTASIHGGGDMASNKIHTLEPSTQYAMRFVNQGNQSTNVFFQLGFSEQFNGMNSIWLGTPDESFVLRAGEELKLTLPTDTTINATAKHDGCKLAVIRQD
jgi:hypothetical protein